MTIIKPRPTRARIASAPMHYICRVHDATRAALVRSARFDCNVDDDALNGVTETADRDDLAWQLEHPEETITGPARWPSDSVLSDSPRTAQLTGTLLQTIVQHRVVASLLLSAKAIDLALYLRRRRGTRVVDERIRVSGCAQTLQTTRALSGAVTLGCTQ